jgi:hypothetical protein
MHGTVYEAQDDRLVRVIDHTGAIHAELLWGPDSGQLIRLIVANATVDGRVITHPLLGHAHVVAATAMTALDWQCPTEIPAIAEPGRIPPGAGSAILNTIAILAQRSGVRALRYAGPYPTTALWRTLARSFRTTATEDAFTAGGLDRALRVARDPIAVDFVPAPHERLAIAGGFVELREEVERAVVAGVAYEPGELAARLVAASAASDAIACEIWFGDAPYARVATLAANGALLDGPHPVPRCDSPVLGREFPAPLRGAIAELVADAVPPPLADAARALCTRQSVRWADLGAHAAADADEAFLVHAVLWDRIGPLGLGRLALAIAEALAPVVTRALVRLTSQLAAARATVETSSEEDIP